MGTARILGGSALQGYLAVRRCRDALRLGAAGILCGGALHEYSRQQARTTLTSKSNNPTVRVGNYLVFRAIIFHAFGVQVRIWDRGVFGSEFKE